MSLSLSLSTPLPPALFRLSLMCTIHLTDVGITDLVSVFILAPDKRETVFLHQDERREGNILLSLTNTSTKSLRRDRPRMHIMCRPSAGRETLLSLFQFRAADEDGFPL